MGKWQNLTAKLKAEVIRFAILNGVSDIKTIRDTYNLYSNGNLEEVLNKVNSSNANFVQRLKDPNRKNIPDWESPTDRISTHKLSVGTDENGNHYIFPEVQEINDELVDFTRPPYHRFAGEISAEMRGDTVRVPSLEEAVKFTETYKQYYPFNNGGNLVHKKSGEELGESQDLNYPNLLPEVVIYPNMLPEVEVKPSVLYRSTHFQDNYNPGLYTDMVPYLPKLILGPVRKTIDYTGRLVKATGNIVPQTGWFFDLAEGIAQQSNLNTAPILSNAGNGYTGLGKLVDLPILKGVGKIIGIPDLIDDSVEFYNALLNRPKEKKVSDWVLQQAVDAIEKVIHTKSTGGPLYPFSFEKNPYLKTPVVRYKDGGLTYTVKSGDYLGKIALANGITITDILAVNPGLNADKINIGQVLNIPGKPNITRQLLGNYIKTYKNKGWTEKDIDYLYSKLSTTDWDPSAIVYAMATESSFNPASKNLITSAKGLAQITDATMRSIYGTQAGDSINNLYTQKKVSTQDAINHAFDFYNYAAKKVTSERDDMSYGRLKTNLLAPNAGRDSKVSKAVKANSLTEELKGWVNLDKTTYRDLAQKYDSVFNTDFYQPFVLMKK